MTINFPASPTDGQTHTKNGVKWKYNSTYSAWLVVDNPILANTTSGQILYNDEDTLKSSSGLSFSATSNTLHVNAVSVAGNITIGSTDVQGVVSSAFSKANTACTNADTAQTIGVAAFGKANTACTNADTAQTIGVAAFSRANSSLLSSSYTASDVLSKLLTVDGVGSGLDADTLDGINSSSFLRSDISQQGGKSYVTHDFNTYPSLYDTYFVNPTGSSNLPTGMSNVLSYRFIMGAGDTTSRGFDLVGAAEGSGNLFIRERSIGTWNKLWHNNNDGSASGLDADLLDGYQSDVGSTSGPANTIVLRNSSGDDYRRYGFAQYFNMSHSVTTRSSDTVFFSSTDAYIRKNDATGMRASLNVPTRTGGDASGTWGISITGDAGTLDGLDSTSFLRSNASDVFSGGVLAVNNDSAIDITNTGQINGLQIFQPTAGADALISFHTAGTFAFHLGLSGDDGQLSVGGWSLGANKYKIWHAGNDGSGSGLDADLLDGINSSSFLRSDTSATNSSDLRAPIFYDSNNTGYYVDPASTSNFYTVIAQNTFYSYSWFRSYGQSGWYNETYGGGVWMSDATWVRIYGTKDFYATASIAAVGNITAYYSDERLKTKISGIDKPIEIIKSLNGFKYVNNELAKQNGYTDDKIQIGLSAQEVEKVLPEIVSLAPFDMETEEFTGVIKSKSGENYMTVDYTKMIPVLVEAIKEQQTQIELMREEIQSLKGVK